jgi:bifunctional ADP-heptose synthase (sugar kinase/adenylyltransferase)
MDIQRQKQFKILVVGDSCEDIYHYGTCDRISPEAPIPIMKEQKTITVKGMSSNVAENLKSFGALVQHITNKKVIRKHRFVDLRFNQHLLRVDEGETELLDRIDIKFLCNIELPDAVIISDYDKGFLTSEDCRQICEHYDLKDVPVFVDTKKNNIECFYNAIVKINEHEYKKLKDKKTKNLIITLGSQGAQWNNKVYSTDKVELSDVCGAGDVFLSSLVYEYMLTNNIENAIMFANKCASYSVTKFGTHVLSPEEIHDLRF